VFVRANPLAWIEGKVERGQSMFKLEHIAAAKRLVTVWDAVGLGVGPASVDLGMPRATRASAPHTPPQHAALVKQIAQQDEIKLVHNYMRGLWPMWECLHGVVIQGMSPTAWADSVHIEPKAANGILLSSLALLARVYNDIDPPVPTPRHRLRTWTVGERSRPDGAWEGGCINALIARENQVFHRWHVRPLVLYPPIISMDAKILYFDIFEIQQALLTKAAVCHRHVLREGL
jgi:hypothetical protein